jgi:hypothetical protein
VSGASDDIELGAQGSNLKLTRYQRPPLCLLSYRPWSRRPDSNRHVDRLQGGPSRQLRYGGIVSEAGLEPALPFRGTSTSSWRVCPSTTRTYPACLPGVPPGSRPYLRNRTAQVDLNHPGRDRAPTPDRTGDLRATRTAL